MIRGFKYTPYGKSTTMRYAVICAIAFITFIAPRGAQSQDVDENLTTESGEFTIADVLKKTNHKMTCRHPHVIADPKEITKEEAHENWIRMKRIEKENNIIH